MTDDETSQRRRARRVTYGAVALLLCVAAVELELWPMTAFRLFSVARTGAGTTLELVAVAPDGARAHVPARSQLLARLPGAPDGEATAMVGAWLDAAGLDAAGLDPGEVASVVLERSSWRLDPRTLDRQETARVVVREVVP